MGTKKTALEWFQMLPEPIRSQAVENWKQKTSWQWDGLFKSLPDALMCGFCWSKSPQFKSNQTYWTDIYTRAKSGEFDKPQQNLNGFSAKIDKEQVIKVYCHIRTIDNNIPDDLLDFIKDSAIDKLSDLNGWIPVSERLPERLKNAHEFDVACGRSEMVMVLSELYKYPLNAQYLHELETWQPMFGGNEVDKVKFWQPLPKLPEVRDGNA